MMTRLLLTIALLAAPCVAQAQPKTVVLDRNRFLCVRLSDADQYNLLLQRGDRDGALRFLDTKESENISGIGPACRSINAGIIVTIRDTAKGSVVPMECFLPDGYIVCLWGTAQPSQ